MAGVRRLGDPDYRFPNPDPTVVHVWIGFVVVLALIGTVWAFRRGRWMLPLAAGAALLIYKLSVQGGQSPYVSAKALVIASPLILLLAVLPLAELSPAGAAVAAGGPAEAPPDASPSGGSTSARPRWARPALAVALVLGLALLYRVGTDDLRGLRNGPVRPTAHIEQLESLRALLAGKETLYLGYDEFARWALAGVPTTGVAEASGVPSVPQRKGKWAYGQAIDFDTVPAATLNAFEYVVAFRDAAGSAVPENLKQVAGTEDFIVYKRVGQVPERSILNEGEWPGAVLDCTTPRGRKIVAAGGVAAVRRKPIVVESPAVQAGHGALAQITLPRGRWQLEAPYQSPYSITVKGPGLDATVPANLERPGPAAAARRGRFHRWPADDQLRSRHHLAGAVDRRGLHRADGRNPGGRKGPCGADPPGMWALCGLVPVGGPLLRPL